MVLILGFPAFRLICDKPTQTTCWTRKPLKSWAPVVENGWQ